MTLTTSEIFQKLEKMLAGSCPYCGTPSVEGQTEFLLLDKRRPPKEVVEIRELLEILNLQ